MSMRGRQHLGAILACACALIGTTRANADVPLGGFTPLVGIGLTQQFQTFDQDPTGFFLADPSASWGGTPFGAGGGYFDFALLDTGAATHILTMTAADLDHFGIHATIVVPGPAPDDVDAFGGINHQTIFGPTGSIELLINEPLGVYIGGLAHSTVSTTVNGPALTMNTSFMRGQTSVATLEAPTAWKLPNIIGLPMAAQNGIVIRNSQPQVFQFGTRTVRTPEVDPIELGTGSQQGIARRTNLRLLPSAAFTGGPFYLQSTEIDNDFNFNFHENPQSPTVLDSAGLYLEVDVSNDGNSKEDKLILFDTGADLTVFSEVFAASLGLDVVLNQPDFFLEVEGSGGVVSGVPGFYVDEMKIDAVGGPIVLQHVPVAVLDVPNPTGPANVIDAILGMHLFSDRDLVIDASPIATNGASPRLYISDPITQAHTWAAPAANGTWATGSNWSAAGTPGNLWIAKVQNTTTSDKTATVAANSQVFQLDVSASSTGRMIVDVLGGATLTTFGEARIDDGGTIVIEETGRLDAQVVNIYGGTLAGKGTIFVGSGPINGVVRNLGGRVTPGGLGNAIGLLSITGDFSNLGDGTLAINLAGLTELTQYDRLTADRFAFLGGTLEVALNGFTPSIGNTFKILTAGQGVNGQFENLVLPAGFTWNVAYNLNDVVLSVTGLGATGDLNSDGAIDARDYVFWRRTAGSAQDYTDWRSHFGMPGSGSGSTVGSSASVPEPGSCILMLFAACGLAIPGHRFTRPARCAA